MSPINSSKTDWIYNQFRKNKVGKPVVANESFIMVFEVFCRLTPLVADCAVCVITTSGLQCLDEMSSWGSGGLDTWYETTGSSVFRLRERKKENLTVWNSLFWNTETSPSVLFDPWWLKYKSTWDDWSTDWAPIINNHQHHHHQLFATKNLQR